MSKSVHHIVQVSSQFQILALCAAIQHGAVPIDKRSSTLLVCNNTPIPEIHPFVLSDEVQQLADLYFGKVVLFNDLTYPLRPKDFSHLLHSGTYGNGYCETILLFHTTHVSI